jgi:bifunctional UDP-N-acetylglucosamine pyrophosphorylase/glucosamine-1-phosphate N-acetyltransferase
LDIRGVLITGVDVEIDINCIFEGNVTLGDKVVIGPNCVISNSTIACDTVINSHSVVDSATIGEACTIGPFARVRPGTELKTNAHLGNFVEVKNSIIDEGSKVNHLSYVGDSDIGKLTNIGAGTITCNYDGANKHRTKMGNGVFIGSNSSLVAPINIADGATVAAGSTITKDIDANKLAITRAIQKSITGWKRPQKPTKK